MHSDPIADLLTRIRNAARAHHVTTTCPYSRVKEDITRLLTKHGYLDSYAIEGDTAATKKLVITFVPERAAFNLRRISTPGRRVYVDSAHLPNVLRGRGLALLTTSSGIMTNRDAKRANIGGEVLLYAW